MVARLAGTRHTRHDGPVHEGGLNDDEVALVLRRAAELSPPLESLGAGPFAYDRAALEEAAAEVGIEPAAVRRALAELDAGALAPTAETAATRSTIVVRRVIARPAPAVDADARLVLRRELFRLRRDTGSRMVWVRSTALAARAVRSVNRVTGHLRLTDIPAIEVHVLAVDDDTTLVQLALDTTSYRRRETGEIVGSAAMGAASLAVGIGGLGLHPLGMAVGAGGAALGALGCAGAAALYRSRLADTEAIAEGVLDELTRDGGRAARAMPRLPRRLSRGYYL